MADYSNRVLRLEGIDWTDVEPAWLIALAQKGWREFSIKGKVTLTEITPTYYEQLMTVYGEHCFEPTAPLFIDAPPTVLMNVPDEIMEGQSVQLSAMVFPVPEMELTPKWLIVSGSRTGVSLSEEGLLTTTENGAADSTFVIRCAYTIGTDYIYNHKEVVIRQRTYPSTSTAQLSITEIDASHKRVVLSWTGTPNSVPVCTWSKSGTDYTKFILTPSEDGLSCLVTVETSETYQYLTGTITCAMKKQNGTSIGSESVSINFLSDEIAITSSSNQYAMALMYSKGFAANRNYMTKSECAAVTESQLQTGSSQSTSIFNSNGNFRSYCTSFNEFKYFTGLTKVPVYLFYNCKIQSIELPPQIKEIGSYAFNGCAELRSILLPSSLETISAYAFRGCTDLTSILLPNSLATIGPYAFQQCYALSEITIPNSVALINDYAFDYCNALEEATLLCAANIPDRMFNSCSKLQRVTVAAGVTSIGNYSFNSCSSLKEVNLPNTITTLGSYCFYGCSKLESIELKGYITRIPGYCFGYCSLLTNVTLPNTVQIIEGSAFAYCRNLENITFPNTLQTIAGGAFDNCKIKNLHIPALVTSLNGRSFSMCPIENITVDSANTTYSSPNNCNAIIKTADNTLVVGAKNTVIPANVREIGEYAFSGRECSSMPLPSGLAVIGQRAFYYCKSLTSITIPDSVVRLNGYTFYECTALESVTLSNRLSILGDDEFYFCTSLTSITLPNSLVTLGTSCFYGCSNLTTVVMSESIVYLPSSTFSGCTNLTTINLPEGLTEISTTVFYGCESLNKLMIPSTVNSIGNSAIQNCGAIKVFFKGMTPPQTNRNFSMSVDTEIYVPYLAVEDYKSATYWSAISNQIYADIVLSTNGNLSITAPQEVSGDDTCCEVDYIFIASGTDVYSGETFTNRQYTGTTMSDEYGKNPSLTQSRVITITLTKNNIIASTTATQKPSHEEKVIVNLNSQWQDSSKNPDTSAYESYESFSNYHVNNGVAKMTLTVSGYRSFTFYIRSYAESTYDYVQVGQLDQEPTPGNTAASYAHTSGKQNSNTSFGNHIAVTFDNLDGGEHVITVIYRKDASGNTGDDRGYVLVPKTYTIIEE